MDANGEEPRSQASVWQRIESCMYKEEPCVEREEMREEDLENERGSVCGAVQSAGQHMTKEASQCANDTLSDTLTHQNDSAATHKKKAHRNPTFFPQLSFSGSQNTTSALSGDLCVSLPIALESGKSVTKWRTFKQEARDGGWSRGWQGSIVTHRKALLRDVISSHVDL